MCRFAKRARPWAAESAKVTQRPMDIVHSEVTRDLSHLLEYFRMMGRGYLSRLGIKKDIGEDIYTHHNVIEEIKDKATKQRLQFLPYRLIVKEANPDAVRFVTEFSKKTGDYPSLSATDIKVLALAYQLEKEFVGTKHIKTEPDTKIEINLATPTPSQPTQIAGFYLGTSQRCDNSRTTSESGCDEETNDVDVAASVLEQQTLEDARQNERTTKDTPETPPVYSEVCDDSGPPVHGLNYDDSFPVLSKDLSHGDDEDDFPETPPVYSEVCDDSGPPVHGLNYDDSFPVLSKDLSHGDDEDDFPETPPVYSEVCDDSGPPVHGLNDDDSFPVLSRDLSHGDDEDDFPETPPVYSEVCDDTGPPVHDLNNDDSFPVLSRDLSHGDDEDDFPETPPVYSEVCDDTGPPVHDLNNDDSFPVLSRDLSHGDDFPELSRNLSKDAENNLLFSRDSAPVTNINLPELSCESPSENSDNISGLSEDISSGNTLCNDFPKPCSDLSLQNTEFPTPFKDPRSGMSEQPHNSKSDLGKLLESARGLSNETSIHPNDTGNDSGIQDVNIDEYPPLVTGNTPDETAEGTNVNEEEYPALHSHRGLASLISQPQSLIDRRQNEENNQRSARVGVLPQGQRMAQAISYAKMTREGEPKVRVIPTAPKVYREGQVLPSNFIEEEAEESDNEEEEEEVVRFDDGEGWITPSNIKAVKKQMGLEDKEQANVVVGCLTTDFAMQNVLIQMGLNVVSVDGMLIKKAKSYVLRCFACFRVTSKMEKVFCPRCGNHTLKRIAMTVNEDGTVKYFFSRRKQLTGRGLRYSLPKPKGGKHATNPVLVADQPRPQQRPSKKALQAMDVFDPDFVISESPFSKHDLSSRAAQMGIMRRGPQGGQRHKVGNKKSKGRRK